MVSATAVWGLQFRLQGGSHGANKPAKSQAAKQFRSSR